MTDSTTLRFRTANVASVLLIALVGVIHMRAAFLPKEKSLFARVPANAVILDEPLAVFGYMVFVVAILVVIVATGTMRRTTVVAIGQAATLAVAATGTLIAHGRTWPILVLVGVLTAAVGPFGRKSAVRT